MRRRANATVTAEASIARRSNVIKILSSSGVLRIRHIECAIKWQTSVLAGLPAWGPGSILVQD